MSDTPIVANHLLTRRIAPGMLAVTACLILGIVAGEGLGLWSGDFTLVEGWWLVMGAGALALVAATFGTAWRGAGLIAAAGLAGASAQLALTHPIWFQFVVIRPSSNFSYVFWLAIAGQAFVAAAALAVRGGYGAVLRTIIGLGPWKVLLTALALFSVSYGALRMIGDHDYRGLVYQFVLAAAFLGINFATVAALARSLPEGALALAAERLGSRLSLPAANEAVRPLDRAFPALVAAWVVVACGLLAALPLQRLPHISDEIAYLFQARSFALGLLSAPPPPPGAIHGLTFDLSTFTNGQWFSIFPPGWPAVLTLGVFVGAPWLVNPLLGGLSILAAHGVVRRLASRGLANLTIVMMAASPWFLGMSASMMSHTLTVALSLGAWWLLLSARTSSRTWLAGLAALGAGAAMGLVFLARPVDGLMIGGLTGLWTLGFLSERRHLWTVMAYGLGCILIGALVFPYNQHMVGDPMLSPVMDYFDRLWHPGANRMGFGPDIGAPASDMGWRFLDPWPGHDPLQALIWTQFNGFSLNVELFGWGAASLALAAIHLVWGRWTKLDLAMGLMIVAIIGAYFLYWFNDGVDIGPRYWFMTFIPFIVLSARGAVTLAERLRAVAGDDAVRRLGAVLLALMVFGVGAFTTWRAATRYFEFRGINADYRPVAHRPDLANALIIVDSHGDKEQVDSARLFNDPTLPKGKPIFAHDDGEAGNRALARAFPDRPVYFISGRTTTGEPTHFTRGPLRLSGENWVPAPH
jgi:hypothetical protein